MYNKPNLAKLIVKKFREEDKDPKVREKALEDMYNAISSKENN